MNSSKDPLDEILTKLGGEYDEYGNLHSWSHDEIKSTKQQILTHYISYEEVDRLIEQIEEYPLNTPDQQLNMANANKTLALRDIKAELKAALKKRRESK